MPSGGAYERGRPDFHVLRSAIARRPCDLDFVAFDLLHLNGSDLRAPPLEERQARLRALIGPVQREILG